MTLAFMISSHFAAYTYVTPFLKDGSQISSGFLSTLLLAYGVAGIVGNFAGGAAAARNLHGTLTAVVVVLAVSVLLLPMARGSSLGVTTLLVLWGLAFGALPIVLQLGSSSLHLMRAKVAVGGLLILYVGCCNLVQVGHGSTAYSGSITGQTNLRNINRHSNPFGG